MTDKVHKASGIRPAQVFATALAALTGAFLASRLGVYGTVAGAGLFSVMTTVGTELYLRSLDRTREAARRTKLAALAHAGRAGQASAGPSQAEPELPEPVQAEPRTRRVRWPLIVGGTVVAFALGMLAVTGIEAITGQTLSGDDGKTLGRVVTGSGTVDQGNHGQTPEPDPVPKPAQAPATTTSEPPTATATTTEPPPEDTSSVEEPEPAEPSDAEPTEEPVTTATGPLPAPQR